MIRNSHINQIHRFRKIAGLLKEDEDFDLSDNPLNVTKKEQQFEDIENIYWSIMDLEPIENYIDIILRVYPEYRDRVKEFEDEDSNIFDELFQKAYNDLERIDPDYYFDF